MDKLLSIIVPVYNVEKYINKCLDSCLIYKIDQDGEKSIDQELMERLEVLVINDGTPDRSAELSREYVNRYPEYFHQIDKENGGHGSVWNLGLKEARGKYIRFLDSDDWLENLGLLVQKLEHCEADLVMTAIECHLANGLVRKQEIVDMEFGKVYNADTFDWIHTHNHPNFVFHHSCTYKAEIFKPFLPMFLEKQPYDDMVLGPASIIAARSLTAYDFIVYHYLMDREGQSISPEVMKKNTDASIKTMKHIICFVEQHPVDEGSSKFLFFKERLPKMYNYGYKSFLDCPYQKSKNLTREWDLWVKANHPDMTTAFIRFYRLLPYFLYWMILKTKLKKK